MRRHLGWALVSVISLAGLGSALAADMAVKAPPPVVAPIYDWTGFYLGGEAGYSWINAATNYPNAFPIGNATTNHPDSGLFGGHVGYRWQLPSRWVLGLEISADSLFNQSVHSTPSGFPAGNDAVIRANWMASARGSVGYAWNRSLLYVTGGAAYLNTDGLTYLPFLVPQVGTNYSSDRWGWTVGAGFAYALTNQWLVNLEYRYANFGTTTYNVPLFVAYQNVKLEQNLVLVGLSYKFGGPVVAKY